jgi:hypothetical protein
MKPGWYARLGKPVYEPALRLLDELYGLRTISFKTRNASVPVHWCDPARILRAPDRHASVRFLRRVGMHHEAVLTKGRPVLATTVIVAAGVWTPRR